MCTCTCTCTCMSVVTTVLLNWMLMSTLLTNSYLCVCVCVCVCGVGSSDPLADSEGCGPESCDIHDSSGYPCQRDRGLWCAPWRAH